MVGVLELTIDELFGEDETFVFGGFGLYGEGVGGGEGGQGGGAAEVLGGLLGLLVRRVEAVHLEGWIMAV